MGKKNKKTASKEIKQVDKKSKVPMFVGLVIILGAIGFGVYWLYDSGNTEESAEISAGNPPTPTKAYEKLFEAVRSKDKAGIKEMMSKDSINLAKMQAGQSKKDIDVVLENGFFTANMTDSLPKIRDERVKGRFGAVEVFSRKKNRWENIPFIVEDGAWKLAAGNMFAGTFKSPGKPRTIIEKENANASGKSDLVEYGNGNLNTNVKPKIIDPTKNGSLKKPTNPTPPKDSPKDEKPSDKKEVK